MSFLLLYLHLVSKTINWLWLFYTSDQRSSLRRGNRRTLNYGASHYLFHNLTCHRSSASSWFLPFHKPPFLPCCTLASPKKSEKKNSCLSPSPHQLANRNKLYAKETERKDHRNVDSNGSKTQMTIRNSFIRLSNCATILYSVKPIMSRGRGKTSRTKLLHVCNGNNAV